MHMQLFRGLRFVKQGVVLLCCASLFKGILGAASEIAAKRLLRSAKQKHDSKYHWVPKMIHKLQLFIPYITLAFPSSLLV